MRALVWLFRQLGRGIIAVALWAYRNLVVASVQRIARAFTAWVRRHSLVILGFAAFVVLGATGSLRDVLDGTKPFLPLLLSLGVLWFGASILLRTARRSLRGGRRKKR